ncbi:MAG: hypothetical protein ACOYXB_16480 [Bacteroidota bacterium]
MEQSFKHDFLISEYQECFSQMRHYDSNTNEILKLCFTFYAGVITLALGVYQFIYQKNPNDNISLFYISLILFLSFIVGLIVAILVVSNRKYFVKVARQVNNIRNYYSKNIDDFENKLPVDNKSPKAYNTKSSQMIIILLLVLTNSLILFFATYSMLRYLDSCLRFTFYFGFILSITYFLLNWFLIKKYLKND